MTMKAQTKIARPTLNAIGKPLSESFDPHRKLKHKTSSSHLFQPYHYTMRFVGDDAPRTPPARHARANERKRERAQEGAPPWLIEADQRNPV